MEIGKEKDISQRYKDMVEKKGPPSSIIKDCVLAFIVGGFICTIGQLVMDAFLSMGITQEAVGSYVSAVMIFLGAFFTGLGVYDSLGKFAGAGSIVPITGFANSIVSPAMEFKKEGYVFGVGAKMFLIAGPVLVYGISTSVIVGILYYIFR